MKKAIAFIIIFALMLCCFTSCDIEDLKKQFGTNVDIDEALPHYSPPSSTSSNVDIDEVMPHYGKTSPPSSTVKKIDPDEALPHYKMKQKR